MISDRQLLQILRTCTLGTRVTNSLRLTVALSSSHREWAVILSRNTLGLKLKDIGWVEYL